MALALGLLCVEAVLVRRLGLAVARLDVTIVLVVFLSIRAGMQEGALSCFAIGYLLDVMSGHASGLYPFLAVLIFLLVRLVVALVDVRSRPLFVGLVAASSIVHSLIAALLTQASTQAGGLWPALSGLPLQTALCALAAMLLWPMLRRMDPGRDRPEVGVLR